MTNIVSLPQWVQDVIGAAGTDTAGGGAFIGSPLDLLQFQGLTTSGSLSFQIGAITTAQTSSQDPASHSTTDRSILKRVAGFAGVKVFLLSATNKIKSFAFPIPCGDFGWIFLSNSLGVVEEAPLRYNPQYLISPTVSHLASLKAQDLSQGKLEDYCLSKFEAFLQSDVVIQVGFIPVWEWWDVTDILPPPPPPDGGSTG